MESLSRPPHRRKHSAATNAFSLGGNNPYDDVLLSRGGKGRTLEANEYSEIFAGSATSIPVLDLSDLDERVGSGDGRISGVDYSNIFGGLSCDDVAAPYEELFNGSAKRVNPQTPADSQPPLRQSGSLHSSGNTKRSSEQTSNQSVSGVQQVFNVSFNKINQKDTDASNLKTHIAQLHSVPGFACFVDENSQQQRTEDHKPMPPLRRDVSRTWSFSMEVEDVKGKRGVSSEANAKSLFSKVPPSSGHPSNPSNSKDPKCTRVPNSTSKARASKNITAEYSPPFPDEEFDKNSVAAASAAALKKAIEQAQESIRIAKLIMERKKEDREDKSRAKSSSRMKDLDKETEIECEVYVSKENNSRKGHEDLDDGKCSVPSLGENDALPNAGNAEVETVWEKVETAKEHGEGFAWGGTLSTFSSGHSERMRLGEEKPEQYQAIYNHVRPEVTVEPTERIRDTSRGAMEQEKAVDGDDETSRTGLEEEVTGKIKNDVDDKKKPGKMSEECEELEGVEHLAATDSAFNHFLNESCDMMDNEVPEEKEMGRKANDASDCKENGHDDGRRYDEGGDGTRWKGAVLSFESQENLEEVLEEEIDARELSVRLEIGRIGKKVEAYEPEIDEKQNHSCGGDMLKLPGKVEQDNIEEWHEDTSECEAAGSQFLEGSNLARDQKNEAFWCVQETNSIVEETGRCEEGHTEERHENTSVCGLDEVRVMEADYFAEPQKHNAFWDVEETNSAIGGIGRSEKDDNEKRRENTFGLEADESLQKEADDFAEVQKSDAFWDVEETNSALGGTGRSEDDHNEVRLENTAEHEVNEIQVTEADNSAEVQKNDAFLDVDETIISVSATGKSGEDHHEKRHAKASEQEADEIRAMEADSFADVQKNDAYWDVDEANISLRATGRSEEHQSVERHKISSDHEADESRVNEATNFVELQKNGPIWDVEDARSEEHHNAFEFREAAYEEYADKAVGADTGAASAIFNETQETCGVELNDTAEQYQKTVNSNMENDTLPAVDNIEMPGVDSLHRSAAEGIFVESKQNNVPDSLASDSKTESVGVIGGDSKESFKEEEHAFKTDSPIHITAQYYAGNNISLDNRNEKFDPSIERPMLEQTSESDEGSASTGSPDNKDKLATHESEVRAENVQDVSPSEQEIVNEPEASNGRTCTEELSEGLHSQSQSEPKEMDKLSETKRTEETSSNTENNDDASGTFAMGEENTKENVQNFERQEQQQRIETIKRAREREKEKLAVERAIREARERAFAEARERAEKAAAERAAVEVQLRVTTEAQGRLDKASAVKQPADRASAVKQPADKSSTEAKLRAERAAVERATAEARGRALEKAMSQKTSTETRTLADRNNGLRHSFSSSDLENTSAAESAQRRKAILERHNRIRERAAKALAEKNMRDLLAQREQAERNRLAESLDADIKRWATGKEGNLRALLSTLQYILGRDSGWQPIPLTEMVTTVAVKKAYRKATLYVHPDKVQQRGASIRQKYICEKVFDLLKAAWNKFNSEER